MDLESLVGRKIRYLDKNDRSWPGKIVAIEDPFVVVKFDEFPMGLGQGQLLDIYEEGDQ